MITPPQTSSPMSLTGSLDSWSVASRPDLSIGRSASRSSESSRLPVSRRSLESVFTLSSPDQSTLLNTAGFFVIYCRKSESAVAGTQFEFGAKPIRVNSRVDWESVWDSAKSGNLMAIPANVRVVSYRTIRAIAADYDEPVASVRECIVYWGPTGTGKSRRAWNEAGMDAYCKDPRSKFWCGYRNQQHIVLDEFRGGIDISHILRWLDRYPVRVEIKGSSRPLCATKFWITSNMNPKDWYPDIDYQTQEALERRMTVINLT